MRFQRLHLQTSTKEEHTIEVYNRQIGATDDDTLSHDKTQSPRTASHDGSPSLEREAGQGRE